MPGRLRIDEGATIRPRLDGTVNGWVRLELIDGRDRTIPVMRREGAGFSGRWTGGTGQESEVLPSGEFTLRAHGAGRSTTQRVVLEPGRCLEVTVR